MVKVKILTYTEEEDEVNEQLRRMGITKKENQPKREYFLKDAYISLDNVIWMTTVSEEHARRGVKSEVCWSSGESFLVDKSIEYLATYYG